MKNALDWYNYSVIIIFIIGVVCFLQLPKNRRREKFYLLPFSLLTIIFFYENLGLYASFNTEFNASVNKFFGNTQNQNYTAWVYNIFNQYIAVALYLFLIQSWLPLAKRKYLNWLILAFAVVILVLLILRVEPIYLNQPMIFAVGANMILIGCGIYFISLITDERYLEANPIRLISFWQVTFFLFTYSLTYITWVSSMYIFSVNPELARSLMQIDRVLGIFNLFILVLIIASPKYPRIFETEPYYGN